VAGLDTGGQEGIVVGALSGGTVETFGEGPAAASDVEGPHVALRPAHELSHLRELVCDSFTDSTAGPAIDQHEER
jgi:hypothetical protein